MVANRAFNPAEYVAEADFQSFAYRVDLRLRPGGGRGPLVRSFAGTLSYYDAMGRTWERQALIKLRPVAGDIALGREFVPWERLPPQIQGSTDLGNLSYRLPSIHPMLAASPLHVTIHNAEFAVWAASELGDAAALDGAKALAMTAIDWFTDDALRRRTRAAFDAGAAS